MHTRAQQLLLPYVCGAAAGSHAIEVSSTVFLYTRTAFFAPRACTFPHAHRDREVERNRVAG